jgi:hypothetical protein
MFRYFIQNKSFGYFPEKNFRSFFKNIWFGWTVKNCISLTKNKL